ncbi:MAG TPA: LLM class flavin-dependent oxidoreductase [Chthoniobacterales bacterium]
MSTSNRKLRLIAFLGSSTGHHVGSWRHPEARRELDIDHLISLAKKAESGLMDGVFLADGYSGRRTKFEPLTQLAALAAATQHIGLVATAGTVYNEPFLLARQFASLDHISGGRAGWNVVTGAQSAAHNFSMTAHPRHDQRYAEGEEFVRVVKQLWDSWDEDAVVGDKAAGIYVDRSKVREINFKGEYYSVKGPLNIPRSPQGRPVIVQAGSSVPGKELAAKTAEAVFTAQQTLGAAQEFYGDLKSRLGKYGRSRDSLLVMPGFAPIIADTEAEARETERELNSYVNTRKALDALSERFTVNLNDYSLDAPVPLDKAKTSDAFDGIQSRHEAVLDPARREGFTIRQLLYRANGGHGHFTFVGTPSQVADFLEYRFRNDAADGFNIMPQLLPSGLNEFIDKVIPELQDRGLFRTEYEGETFRENLGLPLHQQELGPAGV